jgi:hypothetical protein
MFIGYQSIQPLGASLAVSHLLVGGWLIAKGFSSTRSVSDKNLKPE